MYIHTHTYMHACMYVCVYICVYCVYAALFIHMFVQHAVMSFVACLSYVYYLYVIVHGALRVSILPEVLGFDVKDIPEAYLQKTMGRSMWRCTYLQWGYDWLRAQWPFFRRSYGPTTLNPKL